MKKESIFKFYVVFICLCILAYASLLVRDYMVIRCQEEYGLSYNEKRKAMSIPQIPLNWHVKESDDNFIWWTGDEKTLGHKRKSVTFSGCSIEGELDIYTLPLQDGKERLLQIKNIYTAGSQKTSVSYTYQIGHSAKTITKQAVDSILSSENISGD